MTKIKDMTMKEKAEYHKLKTKEWRLKNPEKNKELRIKYKKSEKGKNANQKYQLEYHRNRYEKNPEKYQVDKEYMKIYMRSYFTTKEKREKYLQRQRDYYNFRIGQIKKSECDRCGNKENLEIHHIYYKDDQNIIILCRKCHGIIHRIELKSKEDKNGKRIR